MFAQSTIIAFTHLQLNNTLVDLVVPKQHHEWDGRLEGVIKLVAHLGVRLESKLGLDAGSPKTRRNFHSLDLQIRKGSKVFKGCTMVVLTMTCGLYEHGGSLFPYATSNPTGAYLQPVPNGGYQDLCLSSSDGKACHLGALNSLCVWWEDGLVGMRMESVARLYKVTHNI